MDDFFDSLGKTISNTGKKVSKKASELSSSLKLKMKKKEAENLIEDKYIVLGKEYYEAHKNETSNVNIAKINELKEKIKKIDEELKDYND